MPDSSASAPPADDGARRIRAALEAAQATLRECSARIDRADPRIVHRARVATRRMRSILHTFDAWFSERRATAYRRRLRDVSHALEELRALDVLASAEDLQVPAIAAAVANARHGAVARLQRQRRHQACGRTIETACAPASLARLRLQPDVDESRLVRRVQRVWRRAERRLDPPPKRAAAMHRLRVDLKNVRYSLELVEDILPASAAPLAMRLRDAQTVLGTRRDIEAAIHWLRAGRLPEATVDQAVAQLKRRLKDLDRTLPKALRRLARAGRRWDQALRERGSSGRA